MASPTPPPKFLAELGHAILEPNLRVPQGTYRSHLGGSARPLLGRHPRRVGRPIGLRGDGLQHIIASAGLDVLSMAVCESLTSERWLRPPAPSVVPASSSWHSAASLSAAVAAFSDVLLVAQPRPALRLSAHGPQFEHIGDHPQIGLQDFQVFSPSSKALRENNARATL